MKNRRAAFRKPLIRKFGEVRSLTQQQPQGGTGKCEGIGQNLQGVTYDCT